MCYIWLESRPWIPSSPFLYSMRVCLNFFCFTKDSPDSTFFLTGTEWAIESIIASALSKDLKQSLFLGLQTVWDLLYSYDNTAMTILTVFKVAGLSVRTFQLLSVVGSTLSESYGPIVRFRLPSYSAVSLCIRGIGCKWRTMKRISCWTSRSTSSSTLATMAISSSASIRRSYQTRLTNMTNVMVHLMVGMSWTFSTGFVRR